MLATVAVGSAGGTLSISLDETAGRAYLAGYDPKSGRESLRVLDTARAVLLRATTLSGQPFGFGGLSAVDQWRGRAYVTFGSSILCASMGSNPRACGARVVALDARTGRALRTLPLDASAALVVDGRTGLLYGLSFGALTGFGGTTTPSVGTTRVRVFDPRAGRVVRTIALPGAGGGQGFGFAALAINARGGRLVVVRTFGLFGGARVLSSMVDVIALANGRLLRHIPLPVRTRTGSYSYSPVVIDERRERAFFIEGGGVTTLDLRRGAVVRAIPTGEGVGALVEDGRAGHVFTTALGPMRQVVTGARTGPPARQVPAGIGSLQMLDAQGGTLLRSLPIGPATTGVAVDERRGRVYALSVGYADAHNGYTRPGTLNVVDERGWRVVRTLAVGAVPVALALDRRHDRLLVACAGAFGGTPDDPWGWMPGPLRRLLPFLPHPPAPIGTPHGSVMVLDTTRL